MFTNLQENVIKDLATVYQISTPQLLLIVQCSWHNNLFNKNKDGRRGL